ncbi:hypothetical protein [Anabaena cylindrica]|uniref:hypothetical protein n=1 Tax=Anabaena cylindrica TaxID=1165 RepID=UPI002B20C6F5|nr:hypothetical protein [Anabaena cylindrica]
MLLPLESKSISTNKFYIILLIVFSSILYRLWSSIYTYHSDRTSKMKHLTAAKPVMYVEAST